MSTGDTVAFVGGGFMAESIIRCLLQSGAAAPSAVRVCEILPQRRDQLHRDYPGLAVTAEAMEALSGATIAVLAIKPQEFAKAATSLRTAMPPDTLVLSIMAGVRIAALEEIAPSGRVVRAMPNTAAAVGEAFTTWTGTPNLTDDDRTAVHRLLGSFGREREVPGETYIDMATAVAGSGPGYVALLIEAMIDGAVQIGLPRDLATDLVVQTFRGTAIWAAHEQRHPAELRARVTSPGGTTAAGIHALERGAVRAALIDAVVAAFEKSRALGG